MATAASDRKRPQPKGRNRPKADPSTLEHGGEECSCLKKFGALGDG